MRYERFYGAGAIRVSAKNNKMTGGVWKYQNEDRSVYFRGYVREYRGARYVDRPCAEVRQTLAEAERDVKKLLAKLKTQ